MKLEGKVAVVTGASSGIGAAVASALLAAGAKVVLAGRRGDRLEAVKARSARPEHALAVPMDATRHKDLEGLLAAVVRAHGGLDLLVNNAGVGYGGPLEDLQPAEVEYMLRLNLLAPIWLTQLALPLLHQRPEGRVVIVSSLAARVHVPGISVYCASKAGLAAFASSLRRELRGSRVGVMDVYPGTVDTEMLPQSVHRKMREAGFSRGTPLTADEVAARVLEGLRRGRRTVLPLKAPERALLGLNAVAPGAVDRLLGRMVPHLHDILIDTTREFRARTRLPEPS
jgi:NADP-dependent 3-hydroxy acid dehydrogenase YdfG